MSKEESITYSPLCQTLERDGKKVEVQIYSSGKDHWVLEVIDDNKTSTVWEDPFPTDQAALDEVLDTIEKEGIDCLIGIDLSDYL